MSKKWKELFPESADWTACDACIGYLRNYVVFGRLLNGFKEKYASLGTAGGQVVLRKVTAEDIEILEGFFQKNYHGRSSVTITAKLFSKTLQESRFAAVTLEMLLYSWFDGKLIHKKEEKQKLLDRRDQIFLQAAEQHRGTAVQVWITELLAQQDGAWALLNRWYHDDPVRMEALLKYAAAALNHLPAAAGKTEYLAVFAARITGDPHYFDEGSDGGTLLNHLLRWYLQKKSGGVVQDHVFPAFQRQRVFFEAGILKDDISNYTVVSGLQVRKKSGELHAGMEGFRREGESVQVSLASIAGWGWAICPEGRIYIVENPSIYAVLANHWQGRIACMCMNGQPKLASIVLLDLLMKEKIRIYYAGDFDPEGLLIAQRLKAYCGDQFSYWHMDEAAYQKSCPNKRISEKRQRMLEKVTDPELAMTAKQITKCGMAGYQEKLLELYLAVDQE